MPIYEYQCAACGHHFDTIQTFKDAALTHCPVCGEPTLKKLISAPAFHLKGTGWYATDFKNKTTPNVEAQKDKTLEGAKNDLVSKDNTQKGVMDNKKVVTKNNAVTESSTAKEKSTKASDK